MAKTPYYVDERDQIKALKRLFVLEAQLKTEHWRILGLIKEHLLKSASFLSINTQGG